MTRLVARPMTSVKSAIGARSARVSRTLIKQLRERRDAPSAAPPAAPAAKRAVPEIYIVEQFQLVTVGGDLGIVGSPVASVQVLPQSEKETFLKIKTVKRSEGTITSSAVESQSSEASNALSNSVRNSTTNTHSKETFDYEMEGSMEAEASWGPGGASTSGSIEAQTSSTGVHDTFRNAVDNAVDSQVAQSESYHAQTETTVSSTESTQSETERSERFTLKNDSEKVRNFFFQRVAQERVSALCLVDVKLRLANAATRKFEDFPLSQLDALLAKAISAPEHREELKTGITQFLSTVYDYDDEPQTFVETIDRGGVTALRVVKDLKTKLSVPREDGSKREFTVPGIAIQCDVRLLPTGQLAVVKGVSD